MSESKKRKDYTVSNVVTTTNEDGTVTMTGEYLVPDYFWTKWEWTDVHGDRPCHPNIVAWDCHPAWESEDDQYGDYEVVLAFMCGDVNDWAEEEGHIKS